MVQYSRRHNALSSPVSDEISKLQGMSQKVSETEREFFFLLNNADCRWVDVHALVEATTKFIAALCLTLRRTVAFFRVSNWDITLYGPSNFSQLQRNAICARLKAWSQSSHSAMLQGCSISLQLNRKSSNQNRWKIYWLRCTRSGTVVSNQCNYFTQKNPIGRNARKDGTWTAARSPNTRKVEGNRHDMFGMLHDRSYCFTGTSLMRCFYQATVISEALTYEQSNIVLGVSYKRVSDLVKVPMHICQQVHLKSDKKVDFQAIRR